MSIAAGARPGRAGVRTPTVLQMEAAECGAASLAMVLGYFGKHISLEAARQATAASRDGVSALRIVQAARHFGLQAHGERRPLAEFEDMPVPAIAYWAQSHFLVVEEVRAGRIRVNDPNLGRRWVARELFAAGYSDVVLLFEPGPEFVPDTRRSRPHPLLGLLALVRRSRLGVLFALLAGLLVVIPTTAAALLVSIFVTQVLSAQPADSLIPAVIGIAVVVAVTTTALVFAQQQALLRMRTKLAISMSTAFIWHLVRLPTSYFAARSPGGLVSRVQLNDSVAQLVSGQLATLVISVLTMLLYAFVLFWLNVLLALVVVAVAALNAVALAVVARRRIDANQQVEQAQIRLDGRTFLAASRLEDVKATGADDELFARWSGSQAPSITTEQSYGVLTQSLLVVPGFLSTMSTVAVLGVGGALVIDDRLSIGGLIGFQVLATSFLAPIASVVTASSAFQDAYAWLQQLEDVTNQPTDPALDPPAPRGVRRGPAEGPLDGAIELRGVTFGYVEGAPPLVEDLSFRVEPGQRVALVGATGSGKSTIANLVAGLYEPWSGEVLLDGLRRREIAPEVISASLAKVDQSILLFAGTVADNIRLWDRDVPLDRVLRASADACIADEILAKPGGLGYPLEDGGRNLSGGQRQRIEIARALATEPSVLVLDEATSALDAITEEEIDLNLRRRGCTCLIVAHRLSTIRDCDQILVLDEGAVVEQGTHEELMARRGRYHELVVGE